MTRHGWGAAVAVGVVWGVGIGLAWPIFTALQAHYVAILLVAAGLALAMAVRESTRQRGGIVAAGLVAALVALLFPWVTYPAAVYILPAALLAEVALARTTPHSAAEFGVAGALALLCLLPAHICVEARQLGMDLQGAFWLVMNQVGGLLHLVGLGVAVVLSATVALHALLGVGCGLAALRMTVAAPKGADHGQA